MASKGIGSAGSVVEVAAASMMMAVLFKYLTRPGTAEQISTLGSDFARTLRVAQGLEPLPTSDEKIDRAMAEYLADETDDLAAVEHRLDLELGLIEPQPTGFAYYAQGLTRAMHGRKKGIHTKPGDDPIWGDLGE